MSLHAMEKDNSAEEFLTIADVLKALDQLRKLDPRRPPLRGRHLDYLPLNQWDTTPDDA